MREVSELLWTSVVLRGIRVGRVTGVILERETEQVVGFEIRCEDAKDRFLPRAAATVDGAVLRIESPLSLLDADQLDFYRRRGVTLRSREEPAA